MWDEAGDVELLSLESALLMEVAPPPTVAMAFPPPFEGINPAMPEEAMTSPEAVAMQDEADYPQKPSPPPLFVSGPLTGLKSQQTPKGEVQSATQEEVCYTPKELLEFPNFYRQIQGTSMGMDTKDVE